MWFLIRGAFWFSLVLVMLPIFDKEASTRLEDEKGVQLTDALGAAAGAISYVGSLCSEKPDVCVKGAETFSALGTRAREGALVAYTYLDTQFADDKTSTDKIGGDRSETADAVVTGTVAVTQNLGRIPIPLPRPKNI